MLVYSSMLKKSNEQTATRKKKTLTQKTSTFPLWRYFQWVSKNKPMHTSEHPFSAFYLHKICTFSDQIRLNLGAPGFMFGFMTTKAFA